MTVRIRKDKRAQHELAFLLYMSGETARNISGRINVSEHTIGSWAEKGGWKEKRAASNITRAELINKTLKRINEMLESGEAVNADKLSKLASLVEKLDKKSSPVLIIDIFMEFGRWLKLQGATDREVDIEFIQRVTRCQDAYITEKLSLS
jgi:hypothetical protein